MNAKTFTVRAILILLIASTFATALLTAKPVYSYEEVYDACSAAYSTNVQRRTCIANVCREYGCY